MARTNINYARFVKDAADRMVGHADENQSIWVETLLTHTLSTLFRYQYPATPWATGDLISIDTSPPPGALGVQWTMLGDVGLFDSVADNADDLPLIDLQGSTQYNKAFTVGGAIAYSEQDLQASEMQGLFNIANEKGQAARQAYDRTLDNYIRAGSSKNSCLGVTNLAGRKDLPTTGAWTGLTPSQICNDVISMFDQVFDGTGGVFTPDTIVLPTSVRSIFKRQNSVAANTSIEKYLMETYPEITKWVYDRGMNTAGRGSTAAAVMYVRDPMVLRALLPEFVRPLAPQQINLVTKIPFKSRYAGIACTNPGTVCTMFGI
jgi:hypothetical protein